MDRFGTRIEFAREVARVARRKQLPLLAAAVAFYAFVSLIPIVILGFVVATTVAGEEFARQVTDAVSSVLTPSAQELLTEALTEESGRGGATVVSAAGLVWGGSRVFRGIDRAFSEVYDTVESVTLRRGIRNAGIVAVAVSLGLLAVAGAETILAAATTGFVGALTPAFAFLTILVVFLPLYVVFPGHGTDVGEALPGAAFAAAGWTVLGRIFGIYAGLAGTYAFYGALGAVFLVLTWLYVGSLFVVLGAVVNAVLAGRDVDRQLQSPRGRQVSTGAMTDDREADEASPDRADASARTRDRADDPEALREEIARLRDELGSVEDHVERRTVQREDLEDDLKRYVRRRVRRGHATGWGPYLVLLYGTAMTIGAFYFLDGPWAVLAMLVVWTSTLGVYVLMVLFGTGLSVLGIPGRLRDRVGEWRS